MTTTITAPAARPHVAARVATATVRTLLGLLFATTGANGFLNFLGNDPGPMPEAGVKFLVALSETGYMLQLTAGVQLVAGLLLVANRFVPLALTLLAPVIVNIFLFHLFLAPGMGIAIAVSAAEVYLAWVHRDAFRAILRPTTR